jgi:FAD/FMN-containing dehydrogenase
MCDAGLTINLSGMREVVANVQRERVRIGGGALLGTVDRALVPRGQVMPAGVVSHTGMPGLALGGGVGYLSRPSS